MSVKLGADALRVTRRSGAVFLRRDFNPDEPRDDHGRWTDGGAGGGGTGGDSSGGGGAHNDERYLHSDGKYHVGGDVEAAARLISTGKDVVLEQPRELSTLLDKLKELPKDKVYDLCRVSVAGTNLFCAESKGYARVNMPQLSGVPKPGSIADTLPKDKKGAVDASGLFTMHLEHGGAKVAEEYEDAAFLRASQREIDGAKVANIIDKLKAGKGTKRSGLLISKDNYIVDGHHHWAATVALEYTSGKKLHIPVRRVDMSIVPLLHEANAFTEHVGIPPRAVGKALFAGACCEPRPGAVYLADFNPDEPRDDAGRWTDSGGGGTPAAHEAAGAHRADRIEHLPPKERERAQVAQQKLDRVTSRFGAEAHDVVLDDLSHVKGAERVNSLYDEASGDIVVDYKFAAQAGAPLAHAVEHGISHRRIAVAVADQATNAAMTHYANDHIAELMQQGGKVSEYSARTWKQADEVVSSVTGEGSIIRDHHMNAWTAFALGETLGELHRTHRWSAAPAYRQLDQIVRDAPGNRGKAAAEDALWPSGYPDSTTYVDADGDPVDNEADAELVYRYSGSRAWTESGPKLEVAREFNPDEPRDDHGRWTDGGATSATATKPAAAGNPHAAEMHGVFDRVSKPDGGFTYQPMSGHEPSTGFAVSIYPERSFAKDADKLTYDDLVSYAVRNRDLFEKPDHYIGAWHDPASHRVFLDVSVVSSSAHEAESLARRNDQIAYFDLAGGKSVTVNPDATSGGVKAHGRGRQGRARVARGEAGQDPHRRAPGRAVREAHGQEADRPGARSGAPAPRAVLTADELRTAALIGALIPGVARDFNPDEPRDDHGRWSDGGGGSGGGDHSPQPGGAGGGSAKKVGETAIIDDRRPFAAQGLTRDQWDERYGSKAVNATVGSDPSMAYRSMSQAEYDATVGKGLGVHSDGRWRAPGEQTNFAEDFAGAVGYQTGGSTDPRDTRQRVFVVEVPRSELQPNPLDSGNFHGETGDVRRVWSVAPVGEQLHATVIKTPTTATALHAFRKGDAVRFDGKAADGSVEGSMDVTVVDPWSNRGRVTHVDSRGRAYEGAAEHVPTARVERPARGTRPAKQFEAFHHTLRGGRKKDFDPNEPRDENGRWTDGGGGSGGGQAGRPGEPAAAPAQGVEPGHGGPVQDKARAPNKPVAYVREAADAYNAELGRDPIDARYVPVDEARAHRIADAYDTLPTVDSSPETVAAYHALSNEIEQQWRYAEDRMGMTFEAWTKEGQPYATSKEMRDDVASNKHLYFFTGGEPHPYLGTPGADGLTANDKFRAVHDLFGHAADGYGFGPRGEENAWLVHSQMFSHEAQRALTTETRGQNSWVNFGKQNYNADGSSKNVPPAERPYAVQKVALLPEWASDWRTVMKKSARFYLRDFNPDEPRDDHGRWTDSGGGGGGSAGAGTASGTAAHLPERVDPKVIPRAEKLTDAQRAIETKFADKLASDPRAAWEEYKALPDTRNGKVLSVDIARELSPEYRADRSQSEAAQEPASWFMKQAYAARLQESPGPGENPEVLFLAGGTGAGKTTAIMGAFGGTGASVLDKAQIIFDGNLANVNSNRTKINQALAADKKVIVAYVSRDPVTAFVAGTFPDGPQGGGVLQRAERTGRTVPINAHVNSHLRSRSAAEQLSQEYAGNPHVEFRVIDNHGSRAKTVGSFADLPKPNYTAASLRSDLNAALERAHREHRISDATYRGVKGA